MTKSQQRLLIVSNRLPVTIEAFNHESSSSFEKKNDLNCKWKINMSTGGLVSALSGVQKILNFQWIGWPGKFLFIFFCFCFWFQFLFLIFFILKGMEVDVKDREEFSNLLKVEHACLPIFLDKIVADLHYNGFSNG